MPNDEKQEKEWIKKYGWHEPHKVPQPMFRLSQTEAGCVKCHSGVDLIKGATVLNEGRMGIEKYGCYACHKIEGWEHKRKPGPSLLKIAGKVDKEFFKSWVWSPKSFNAHAKMPQFFMQPNNGGQITSNIASNAPTTLAWEVYAAIRTTAVYSSQATRTTSLQISGTPVFVPVVYDSTSVVPTSYAYYWRGIVQVYSELPNPVNVVWVVNLDSSGLVSYSNRFYLYGFRLTNLAIS